MRLVLGLIAAACVALFAAPAAAGEYPTTTTPDHGPPPAPMVDCNIAALGDLPPDAVVTFHVTVETVPPGSAVSEEIIGEAGYEEYEVVADISHLTAIDGPIRISVYATWDIGPGESETTVYEATCHEPPPTTTTTEPPTTTTTVPETTVPPTNPPPAPPPTEPPELPETGAPIGALAGISTALLGSGALAVWRGRRR